MYMGKGCTFSEQTRFQEAADEKNCWYFRQGKITSCQLCLFVGPRDLCLPICRGLERDGSRGLCLDNPRGNSEYIKRGERRGFVLVDEERLGNGREM